MHGLPSQARLLGIDHPHFPENLGVAEPMGSGVRCHPFGAPTAPAEIRDRPRVFRLRPALLGSG
jgi:hypothetical protein